MDELIGKVLAEVAEPMTVIVIENEADRQKFLPIAPWLKIGDTLRLRPPVQYQMKGKGKGKGSKKKGC